MNIITIYYHTWRCLKANLCWFALLRQYNCWQWHRTGYCWLPVQTLPVAPLWCDLRNCSPTVVAINLCLMNFHHFAWEIRAEKLWQSHFDVLKVNKKPWCCWIETSDRYAWARGMWFQSKKTKRKTKLSKSHHLTF